MSFLSPNAAAARQQQPWWRSFSTPIFTLSAFSNSATDVSQTQPLANRSASSSSESLPTSEIPSFTSTPLTTPGLSEDEAESLSLSPVEEGGYVLVIGGLGYIGSHTTLELMKAGYNVVVVDDLSNSYDTALEHIKTLASTYHKSNHTTMPAIHFHKMDYRSRKMSSVLEKYAASPRPAPCSTEQRKSKIVGVIHFAAFKSVSESIDMPIPYYQNNVCGLVNLMEQLHKFGIKNFVFSSSATVYGNKANLGRQLREEDLVHHPTMVKDVESGELVEAQPEVSGLTSPYGRSKYFCEAILADIAVSDPSWRIIALRYFNPVGCEPTGRLGEEPRMQPTNLFPVLAQVLSGEREKLKVFGNDWDTEDGTAIRDFVHVVDVARGHVKAVDRVLEETHPAPGATPKAFPPFRTFNLGSGTGTTVKQALRSMEVASGKAIPFDEVERRAGDVGICVASNSRAQSELGWLPQESIAACARDCWNYISSYSAKKQL